MKKTILIFGAGLNQYLLIKAARDLGITTVVLDPDHNAPGKEIADYFYVVAGKDYETTKQIAMKHKIDGLATTQMERPLYLMARLEQELIVTFHLISRQLVYVVLIIRSYKNVYLQRHCISGH